MQIVYNDQLPGSAEDAQQCAHIAQLPARQGIGVRTRCIREHVHEGPHWDDYIQWG